MQETLSQNVVNSQPTEVLIVADDKQQITVIEQSDHVMIRSSNFW